jgi:hypothetical protein
MTSTGLTNVVPGICVRPTSKSRSRVSKIINARITAAPPAMKLYVHYEETDNAGDAVDDKALTLKLTLPKSWVAQPLLQVLKLFLESYNKKQASLPPLDVASVHLEKAG